MFEVACFNPESVALAVQGGANRIELCSAPAEGGLTPSPGAVQHALRVAGTIPVHVMLRCREGNFIYSPAEKKLMLDDLKWIAESGAAGVVFGALKENMEPDQAFMQELLVEKKNLRTVFHRAMDVCHNLFESLEIIKRLGIDEVLSSGGASTARAGKETLKKLKEQAAGRIKIIAGGGVRSENLLELLSDANPDAVHLSGIKQSETEAFLKGTQSFTLDSPYMPDLIELRKCSELSRNHWNRIK